MAIAVLYEAPSHPADETTIKMHEVFMASLTSTARLALPASLDRPISDLPLIVTSLLGGEQVLVLGTSLPASGPVLVPASLVP
jgi:hypothetical protein